jgi:predicted  nucleic acid-binding Zn ribbon protein
LKNVYSDAIVEQQNLAAVARKLFTKAKGVRWVAITTRSQSASAETAPAWELATRTIRSSHSPAPAGEEVPNLRSRRVRRDPGVFDKDIQNSKDNKQAFINHLDDEVTQIAKDVMKHMNIMTYGDGTGTLTVVNANTGEL